MTVIDVIKTLVEQFEGTIRFNYSGRGMYGKECVGIVCDYPGEVEDYCKELGFDDSSIDNMGLNYIVYWPNINFTEKEYNMSEVVELNEVDEVDDSLKGFIKHLVEEEEEDEEVMEENVVEELEEVEEAVVEKVAEQPEVSLTEKQVILINIFKSDIHKAWVAGDLADETTELTKKQISGVLASMKKKNVIVKGNDGWSITEIGQSC